MISTRNKLIAIGAAAAMFATACGSDSETEPVEDAPTTTEAEADDMADDDMADDDMADDMADDDMADDDMADGDMADDMAGDPFGPACAAVPADGEGSFAGMTDDPAATAASNNPLLSTLVSAVGEAGLVDTLNGDGPFTIFAPTNDAFDAIPADDLEAVLADTDLLTSILTYHVVAGESLDAAALGEAGTVETVNTATLEFGSDGTTVNGVDVLCSNVMTANATVHIIGEVLMPPTTDAPDDGSTDEGAMDENAMDDGQMAGMPTGPLCAAVPTEGEGSFDGMTDDPAATAASNNPALSTLVAAVTEAGLVDTLNSDGPFTIFAPADPAFEALPAEQLESVLADVDLLTSILTLHVVAGERLSSDDLAGLDSVTTVNGADITIETEGDTLVVNGQANVGCADVQTANAVVHIIDGVLLPS